MSLWYRDLGSTLELGRDLGCSEHVSTVFFDVVQVVFDEYEV